MRAPAIVIPAAGRARRMGEPKLLLRYRGETLLARAVRVARTLDPEPVVVVRAGDVEARRVAEGSGARVLTNQGPERGPASSIAVGIGDVLSRPSGPRPVLVLLPDMPLVDAAMLETLVTAGASARGGCIVSAVYGGVRAPPVILPCRLLPALTGATGTLRQALRGLPHEVAEIPLPRAALDDVDTPADRRRLLIEA